MRPLLLAGLMLVAWGCDYLDRTGECREVASVLNPKLDRLAGTVGHRLQDDSTVWSKVADSYASTSRDLERIAIRDAQLSRNTTDLQLNLSSAKDAARRGALALVQHDRAALERARSDLRSLARRHTVLINSLQAYCRSP